MIQAIMLIALGFLAASFIGVLVAPSLWNRASRLTKKKLESTLPLTLAEIEAAQDQLRASYAVRLRRLETALASAKQKAANQLVDNSRLQMQIAALKDQIGDLDMKLSERRNAATVLEQTITKRFPELDREIAAVKTQLQERSFELQDLNNKLARRDEELAAAQRAASTYQDEIDRLRSAMEKSAADRGGRRVRKASQWDLEDYKAEYDRLNLEMSKLRQQLAHFQDRDAQQVSVIKGELQKLAELILASAQPKAPPRPAVERQEIFGRRPGASALEPRKDRPAPWLQSGASPMPLTARLKLAEAAESAPPAHLPAASVRDRSETQAGPSPVSPVLSILPDETVLTAAPKNALADTGLRTKILRDVVAHEAVETSRLAEGAGESAAPAVIGDEPGGAIPSDSSETGLKTAAPFAETITLVAEAAAAETAGGEPASEDTAPAPETEGAAETHARSFDDDGPASQTETVPLVHHAESLGGEAQVDQVSPAAEAEAAPTHELEAARQPDPQSSDGLLEEAAPVAEMEITPAVLVQSEALLEEAGEMMAAPQVHVQNHGDEAEATEAKALIGEAPIAEASEAASAPEIEEAAAAETPAAAEEEAQAENGHAAEKPAAANGHAAGEREPDMADLRDARDIDGFAADAERETKAVAQPSSLLERLRAAEDGAEAKQ
jgi:hypothetical protein